MTKTPRRQISGYVPMRKSKGFLNFDTHMAHVHQWRWLKMVDPNWYAVAVFLPLRQCLPFLSRIWHIVDVLASYQNCICYFNPTRIPHHRHHLCHYHLCHFCHTRRRRHHIIRWHPPLTAFKILIRWTRPPGLGQKMFRNYYFLVDQQSFLLVTYTENRCNPCSSSTNHHLTPIFRTAIKMGE